ncbi:MAG: LPS translocon maturation chaperone LptM [Stenotrophomonas sp.]
MNMTSRSLLFPAVAAAALLLLSACGNKGPLVMPQKPVPIEEQTVEPAADADSQNEAGHKADEAVQTPTPVNDDGND